MVQVMRLADEASDLRGMTAEIFDILDGSSSGDRLKELLRLFDNWCHDIARIVTAIPHASAQSRLAPPPGPIKDLNDPQKGRWGNSSARDGRRLGVVLTGETQSAFDFDVYVESADGSELQGPVLFHLHSTYPRSVIHVNRVRNNRATLFQIASYGMFTVGAQVKDASGRWTALELDLLDVPNIPERFRHK
jgi:hypothetical protein